MKRRRSGQGSRTVFLPKVSERWSGTPLALDFVTHDLCGTCPSGAACSLLTAQGPPLP